MNKDEKVTAMNQNGSLPVSSMNDDLTQELLRTKMLESPTRPGQIGKVGRFEIVRILGVGGMGEVLLANEPLTDTLVAVKMIKPELRGQAEITRRFLSEARHMYQMHHPKVLKVMEVCERQEGPYYVMPYIKSGSLRHRLAAAGGALTPDEIIMIAKDLAEGLVYAHDKGVIHRDLKPENVLLDEQGQAYLTDFGLVRTVFNDETVNVQKHRVEGTPAYMSPGVAKGKAEDTRCDIYAFGALLYEMLTGLQPYQGKNAEEILRKIIDTSPKPIREIKPDAPEQLVKIAEKAMARELRDRYAEMADVLDDLRNVGAKRKNKSAQKGDSVNIPGLVEIEDSDECERVSILGGLVEVEEKDGKARVSVGGKDIVTTNETHGGTRGSTSKKTRNKAEVPISEKESKFRPIINFVGWTGLMLSTMTILYFGGYCILLEKADYGSASIAIVCCCMALIHIFSGIIIIKKPRKNGPKNKDGMDTNSKNEDEQKVSMNGRNILFWEKTPLFLLGSVFLGVIMAFSYNIANIWIRMPLGAMVFAVFAYLILVLSSKPKPLTNNDAKVAEPTMCLNLKWPILGCLAIFLVLLSIIIIPIIMFLGIPVLMAPIRVKRSNGPSEITSTIVPQSQTNIALTENREFSDDTVSHKQFQDFEKAAKQGDAEAQNNLGVCYAKGLGVKQNYKKAVECYQKAAKQNYAMAQNNLGICYYFGQGVEQSYPKAFEWYEKAAGQNHSDAQNSIGSCYYNGLGVKQDYTKAIEWLEKSAKQNNARAQTNLGICYYKGQGVEKNYLKAVEWYEKAAKQNFAKAQLNLGVSYYKGQGVEKNLKKAAEYFNKAAKQGVTGQQKKTIASDIQVSQKKGRSRFLSNTGNGTQIIINGKSYSGANGEMIIGSGVEASENRNTAEFSNIHLTGAINTVVQVGQERQVVVSGDDNIVSLVKTKVDQGTLLISMEGSFSPKIPVKVTISNPSLNGLTVSGTSTSRILGLNNKSFQVRINGIANLQIAGKTEFLLAKIFGTGSLQAENLDALSADVAVSGAGNARISVKNKLNATVAGTGKIVYYGNPALTKKTSGLGSVIKGN